MGKCSVPSGLKAGVVSVLFDRLWQSSPETLIYQIIPSYHCVKQCCIQDRLVDIVQRGSTLLHRFQHILYVPLPLLVKGSFGPQIQDRVVGRTRKLKKTMISGDSNITRNIGHQRCKVPTALR